jgi:small subunit ribosomal protein S9
MSSTNQKYHYGVGRRKAATARAKFYNDSNKLEITVNNKSPEKHFDDFNYKTIANMLTTVGVKSGIIKIYVKGGGLMGQSEAARLAISKALLAFDEDYKPILRANGYITTDTRKVLPKRPGLRKARKREQWSKR